MPADDPEARRSRRDLRRINFFMGNERWICREVRRFPEVAGHGIVEIGAGDGELCHQLALMFPNAPVAAYDLAPAPDFPGSRVVWHQGDLFETPAPTGGGVLVANLFVHHFEGAALTALGRWMMTRPRRRLRTEWIQCVCAARRCGSFRGGKAAPG